MAEPIVGFLSPRILKAGQWVIGFAVRKFRQLSVSRSTVPITKNLAGIYWARDFEKSADGTETDRRVLNPVGCARIEPAADGKSFSLGHFSDGKKMVWTGEVQLSGSWPVRFYWKYGVLHNQISAEKGELRSGFKDIIRDGDEFVLYGEKGFGREVLTPISKDKWLPEGEPCPFCLTRHESPREPLSRL